MKKKWILCMLFLSLFLLTSCKKEEEQLITGPVIYYLNPEGTGLIAEDYEITGETAEEQANNILKDMQSVDEEIEYKSAFPEGVSVEKWEIKDAVMHLYFDHNYNNMDKSSEVLLRAAIVQSLTQLDEINYVLFYVDGEMLKNKDGNEIGYQGSGDFIQNIGSSLHSYQEVQLKLYFVNSKGDALASETKSVRYNSNMSIEKLIVEELLEGPEDNSYKATFPADTKVLGVSVKDGICYVNFDENFLKQPAVVEPKLAIYSLVNSIIEGGNTSEVQLLVNGETNVKYQESIDFSKPFSRNLDVIGEAK